MNTKHSVKIKLLIVFLGLGAGTSLWASSSQTTPQPNLYREIRYKPQFQLYMGGGIVVEFIQIHYIPHYSENQNV